MAEAFYDSYTDTDIGSDDTASVVRVGHDGQSAGQSIAASR